MLPVLRCVWVQRDLESTVLLLRSSLQPAEARLLVEVDRDHPERKHSLYKFLQVHLHCRYVSSLCDLL